MVVMPPGTFEDFGDATDDLSLALTTLGSSGVAGNGAMPTFCSNILMRDVVGGIDVVSVGPCNATLSVLSPWDDRVRGFGGTAGVLVAATLALLPSLPLLPLFPLPAWSLFVAKGGARAFATNAA